MKQVALWECICKLGRATGLLHIGARAFRPHAWLSATVRVGCQRPVKDFIMDPYEAQAKLAQYQHRNSNKNNKQSLIVVALVVVPLVTALIWVFAFFTW